MDPLEVLARARLAKERRETAQRWLAEHGQAPSDHGPSPSNLRARTIYALQTAVALLWATNPVLDTQLRNNGWTEDLAQDLGEYIDELSLQLNLRPTR